MVNWSDDQLRLRCGRPMSSDREANQSHEVGMVLGTESATPLDWWVAIEPEQYLQLDDVVLVTTAMPDGAEVRISGVVDMVRAQHEGSRFESDVFLVDQGVLPLQIARSAHVVSTRVEPEIWVPPQPGDRVVRVRGSERAEALHFDAMGQPLAAGLSGDGQRVYIDLSFLDGRRGAHINISGVSGVATKTTYASFILYTLFHSGVLGGEAANTKALVFNVKGEDLLFLDRANASLTDEARARYEQLGLPAGPFDSVGIWAPSRRNAEVPTPDTGSRQDGVRAYFWTVRDLVREGLLRFMFAEAGDERSQIADLVTRVEAALQREAEDVPDSPATVTLPDADGSRTHVKSFSELCELIDRRLSEEHSGWAGYIAGGTIAAFLRRL